jgi:hypothetical protein
MTPQRDSELVLLRMMMIGELVLLRMMMIGELVLLRADLSLFVNEEAQNGLGSTYVDRTLAYFA